MGNMESHFSEDARVDLAILEYLQAQERGDFLSAEDFLARYSDVIDEFREFLADRAACGATPELRNDDSGRVRCPRCGMGILGEDAQTALMPQDIHEITCPMCSTRVELGESLANVTIVESLGGRTIGRYRLVRLVGFGHFGEVWEARDDAIQRTVAVKLPRTDAMGVQEQARFLREAQAAAQLDHASIVRILDVGTDAGRPYIVSEYLAGGNLADRLKTVVPGSRETAEWGAQLADALEVLHRAGVIHRDVKPANILFDSAGQPHLADFGLARLMEAAATLTERDQVLGTPMYMSPEQAFGKSHAAQAHADIYSLGIVLYELLVGRPPFQGTVQAVLQMVRFESPVPPRKRRPEIPRDLETICLKAIEKDPKDRYQTARELAEDLRRYLRNEPLVTTRPGWVITTARSIRRHPALSALTAACLLLGGLLVATMMHSGNPKFAETPQVPPEHLGHTSETARRTVVVETEPAGARLAIAPISPDTGAPLDDEAMIFAETTPATIEIPAGTFLVVVERSGHGFHEVMRTVPRENQVSERQLYSSWESSIDGSIRWPVITIPPTGVATAGMALFSGGDLLAGEVGSQPTPAHHRRVDPFYIETSEVSVGKFRNVHTAVPAPLEGQASEQDPVTFVSFPMAVDYAERIGRRLPDEFEYEWAARQGGATLRPWGDDLTVETAWIFGPVGIPEFDRTPTEPPVRNLFSNVAEWTSSRPWPYPGIPGVPAPELIRVCRVIRGGTQSVIERKEFDGTFGKPCDRPGYEERRLLPGVGFRCVRSAAPRYLNSRDE